MRGAGSGDYWHRGRFSTEQRISMVEKRVLSVRKGCIFDRDKEIRGKGVESLRRQRTVQEVWLNAGVSASSFTIFCPKSIE
jgi:hypothetical protein